MDLVVDATAVPPRSTVRLEHYSVSVVDGLLITITVATVFKFTKKISKRGSSFQLVTRVRPVGRRPSSTKRRGNVLVLMLVVVAAVESVAAAPMT